MIDATVSNKDICQGNSESKVCGRVHFFQLADSIMGNILIKNRGQVA